jgi:hypothetical protein
LIARIPGLANAEAAQENQPADALAAEPEVDDEVAEDWPM